MLPEAHLGEEQIPAVIRSLRQPGKPGMRVSGQGTLDVLWGDRHLDEIPGEHGYKDACVGFQTEGSMVLALPGPVQDGNVARTVVPSPGVLST